MATCPRCFGPLTENHKCPRGLSSRVVHALTTVGVGGGIGAVVCVLVEDHPAGALIVAAAALGAVLATALRQAIEGPTR